MKMILTILLLTISVAAAAQLQFGVKQNINAKGYVWKEGQFDSSFILPRDTFRVLPRDSNALAFKKGCLYVVSAGVWQLLACAGGAPGGTPGTFGFSVMPESKTVTSGVDFTLTSTVVNGTGPYTWNWYKLGTGSPVATSTGAPATTTQTIPAIAADARYYVVATTSANGSITSDTNNVTVSVAPSIVYGYSSTDPYTDNSTAPTVSNPTTISITHNANLSLTYPAAAVDKFLIVKVPVGESTKVTWYVEDVNQGTIPDAAFRASFVVGSFRYYVTRDPAGFTFNYSLPVQLRQ